MDSGISSLSNLGFRAFKVQGIRDWRVLGSGFEFIIYVSGLSWGPRLLSRCECWLSQDSCVLGGGFPFKTLRRTRLDLFNLVVSQNSGYLFGGPYNQDYDILGSILGSPYFGKLPFGLNMVPLFQETLSLLGAQLCIQDLRWMEEIWHHLRFPESTAEGGETLNPKRFPPFTVSATSLQGSAWLRAGG